MGLRLFTSPWLSLSSPVAWLRAFGIERPAPPLQSTAARSAHLVGDCGGRRRFGGMASASVAIFAFWVWLWVLWDDSGGYSALQSRLSESARGKPRSQEFPIPADKFPHELVCVCYFVGKSREWRGLDSDAAFTSHFVMPGGFSGAQAASGAIQRGRPPSWPRDSDNVRVTRARGPDACRVLRRAEVRCTGSQTPSGTRAQIVIRGGVPDLSHTVPLAGRTGRPAGPGAGAASVRQRPPNRGTQTTRSPQNHPPGSSPGDTCRRPSLSHPAISHHPAVTP